MAVPFINFLAPSMGGIGPIELVDLPRLAELQGPGGNGVPFYAGRFYPKDNQAIIDGLQLGLISQTPPWLTWERIQPTQIWMIPAFEDERIVTMNVTIERIDLWPRLDEDYEGMDPQTAQKLLAFEPPGYGGSVETDAWGSVNLLPSFGGDSIDPGITINQNLNYIPPGLTLGYLGIAEVQGVCTEWGFYDQELTIVNGTKYGQAQYGYGGADALGYDYSEIIKVRPDGSWIYRDAEIPSEGTLPSYDNLADRGFFVPYVQNSSYYNSAIFEEQYAYRFGNQYWNTLTGIDNSGNARAGMITEIRTSQMDCLVYTIKVACTTIVVPDALAGQDEITRQAYAQAALESFGSNLSNNIWYFYLPVRYNGGIPNQRIEYLLNNTAINRINLDTEQ